ncbi:uncharacterized protein EV422DRAFT_567461 [Fimicolochytrium jonesii]|uniref:uncharacterized protein n=1 Tax=Fimicolochytrium jonesii TaxID=1396493 RepID=UPI0022FF06C6|nr:uncharacterized protein EV422DRAFT_567461 [Fimicolochytrium jonesii]KAI8821132.1 hypothetical protein EV422DRAFT_567461 [Fimicolochytrium jonesii]
MSTQSNPRPLAALGLLQYLDSLPQPAVVLTVGSSFAEQTISYVNPSLYAALNTTHNLVEGSPIADLILVDNPCEFENWISFVCASGQSPQPFTTQIINSRWTSPSRSAALVEWSAVWMRPEYITLTGKWLAESSTTIEQIDTGEIVESFGDLTHPTGWKAIPRLAKSFAGGGVMGQLLREVDWTESHLGPVHTWPQSLMTALALMLASPFPMSIWWGPKFILLYNDAYIPICAGKHPWLFGKPGAEAWSEIWDDLKGPAEQALLGAGKHTVDDLLFMTRNGFPEETYHTWSYVPIRQEDGSVGGLLNPTVETSRQVIAQRRLKALREYSVAAGQAKDVSNLLSITADVLRASERDVTFALLYTGSSEIAEATNGDVDIGRPFSLRLAEVIGITRDHRAAIEDITVDLSRDFELPQIWPFHEVCTKRTTVEVRNQELVEGIPGRGFGDPSKIVVVCPIAGSEAEDIQGVMIIGTSSRLPYDEDYITFIELLFRQTASSLSNIMAFNEEVKRADALATIDRAKTAFFSSVSHELRTPLTLMLGPLEDLLTTSKESPTAFQMERLTLINRNARRLLKLVNSILDFSRLEAGRMQASFRKTHVAALTRDLASVFRSAIEKRGVKYEVQCDESCEAYIDRDMWEKVVFNLIGNAFKFTMKGTIRVSVATSSDKMRFIFSVQDSGIGIPSDQLDRVFERFHRVEGASGRSHEGTGIGLALTQELVKLHGGELWTESTVGAGSTFFVQIPLGSSHLPPDMVSEDFNKTEEAEHTVGSLTYGSSIIEEANHWMSLRDNDGNSTPVDHATTSSEPTLSETSTTMQPRLPVTTRGCRVLLADDNADMRAYVKSILGKVWRVTEVSDGLQALESVKANPPDCIVSDIMMPNLDGIGLLRALKGDPKTKGIPVILLSARAGEEARVDGLQMGADDYLVKPFSGKELKARVQSHLEVSRLRLELEKRVQERTKELAESEWRYKTMSSLSPVGIFKSNNKGHLTYANEKFWEISMHDRVLDPAGKKIFGAVHHEDRDHAKEEWQKALKLPRHSAEFRYYDETKGVEHWVLQETILEYNEEGRSIGLLGTITDLTERKRLEKERLEALEMAEKYQRRRAEEAESVKRKQELFIDMTCHELRNPLNGIYHNADLVYESLQNVNRQAQMMRKTLGSMQWGETNEPSMASLENVLNKMEEELTHDVDAVETIIQCAHHQKNIADDVLQVSKISMNLLHISNDSFQPYVEVKNAIRVFETEAKIKGTSLSLIVDPEYEKLGVDWVCGDPKRLSQIMLNLLTNAMRFTNPVKKGEIKVLLNASSAQPFDAPRMLDEDLMNVDDAESSVGESAKHTDIEVTSPGPPIYISISVSDTGVGMTQDEQQQLFRRFSQPAIKTYGDFGGSGLGLFITKKLVELQGGQILVESTKGVGTTFKFYIRYELRDPPANPPDRTRTTESQKHLGLETRKRSFSPNTPIEGSSRPKHGSQQKLSQKLSSGSLSKGFRSTPSSLSVTSDLQESLVMVVEDNVVNQKVLKKQLENVGYKVRIANHGGEAVDLFVAIGSQFDIILMDLEMPVKDGLTAAAEIRQLEVANGGIATPHGARVPIVAITGNARNEYLQKALSVGMDDLVTKPYSKPDLFAKIDKLVRSRKSLAVPTVG